MHYVEVQIRPTSALTFRQIPGSILHIATYPFLPPTTMSGFLRRLLLCQAGYPLPATQVKNPDYYALPPGYHVLGALPCPRTAYRIHTTRRQGIRSFNHAAFSRIVRAPKQKEVYQLHTWEYLLVGDLTGYVVSEEADALNLLRKVENAGCKIGKEGYAFVESVSEVRELQQERARAAPSSFVPAELLRGAAYTLYALYRYEWKKGAMADLFAAPDAPSPVQGFVPFRAAVTDSAVELDSYTDGQVYIPVGLLEYL
jgi:hypothetical protein